jgi:hypothetical protein
MKKIEIAEFRDFSHAGGEGQIVWREFKERITRDRDLVIKDAVVAAREPEGLRVGDEVDFVAGCGEFNAELGSDNSRASIGGVTGNANSHSAALLSLDRRKYFEVPVFLFDDTEEREDAEGELRSAQS